MVRQLHKEEREKTKKKGEKERDKELLCGTSPEE